MPGTLDSAKIQRWHSQAPANTMILGEHSVVYGHPALACAVNQYIHIEWHSRPDSAINISSDLGQHHTQLDKITPHPKLNFVICALQAFQQYIPCGLDIEIKSEFSSTIGLGSSAAVLAAMLSGLNQICGTKYNVIELFLIGHKIIIDIQGRGSGTDLAASLSGGIIYFQPKNQQLTIPTIKKLNYSFPLVLIYSGYKMPTAEVLALVASCWEDKPHQLEMLYRSMGRITRAAFQALSNNDMELFYQACKDYQLQMEKLGVSDETLQKIIETMNGCAEIQAAKISGSGLGDCILGIGSLTECSTTSQNTLQQFQQFSINISIDGAHTKSLG